METDGRGTDVLTAFVVGVGILLLIPGPCANLYGMSIGSMTLVACWVAAITLRVHCFGGTSDERHSHYHWSQDSADAGKIQRTSITSRG